MTDLSGRLASGDTLYGTFLGLGSALAAEACALAGFDWLLTDLEHGGGDESELLHQQLAADAHAVPMLVRVESTHRIPAGHALDLGAAGIMFPGIETMSRHRSGPVTASAAAALALAPAAGPPGPPAVPFQRRGPSPSPARAAAAPSRWPGHGPAAPSRWPAHEPAAPSQWPARAPAPWQQRDRGHSVPCSGHDPRTLPQRPAR